MKQSPRRGRCLPESPIRKAIVLAAGRGARMADHTNEMPKAMLSVHGRPMLEHVLDALARSGIEQFLLVVGYRREVIEEWFRDWRLPIEFRVQALPDGTGSAARLGREFAGPDPFVLTFGDILCRSQSYTDHARVLAENPDAAAVLGVRNVDDPWQGAAVYADGNRVTRILEKPPRGTSTTRWNSAGVYAMRPEVFPYLDRLTPSVRGEYELTSIFEMLLQEGRDVRLCPIEGHWRDVGRPEDLEAVNSLRIE